MSLTIEEKLQDLEDKIRLLQSSFSVLLAQNKQLKTDKKQLQYEIETKNNVLQELEKKYKNLELAKAVSSDNSEANINARENIEEIIREIDTCITLLNT
ncbi:MAG: hypothetical protein PF481_09100 [Bacteroidales bacterium]|jgi:peptidoglycan hydrolase CwlO-like protein|nr:hypothetical protein [Bacteroidales bacterium]